MNWSEAKQKGIELLEAALDLHRHAKAVASFPSTQVPADLAAKLDEHVPMARRQLDRLKSNEFRIAVVGLEKAGKSTFVNAWLCCDLLPTAQTRCTYTPTQIYSVTSEREQRLEVFPKSREEFDALIAELRHSPAKEAQEDLRTIERHRPSLDGVVREGPQTIRFVNLEEIRPELQKYVADPRYAHAIREVRLWTTQLAAAEGIVFYDVPGMDSGLAKTLEDNRQMLEDSDAIIVVMRDPSLKGSEKELVRMAVRGDAIPVSEKLFVFLGRADTFKTPGSWRQCVQEAKKSWSDIGHPVDEKRFVAGSAGAHLRLLVPNLRKETAETLGPREQMLSALRLVTGVNFPETQAADHTGIGAFKKAVQRYLDTDRSRILIQRCAIAASQIRETAREISEIAARFVPSNPDEVADLEQWRRRNEFSKWWGDDNSGRWRQTRGRLNEYRKTHIFDESGDGTPRLRRLAEWLEAFREGFSGRMAALPSRQPETRTEIFKSAANPAFDPLTGNQQWRGALYIDVLRAIELSAAELAHNLHAFIEEVKAFVRRELFWNSPRTDHILADLLCADRAYLENALKILFLRWARPLADMLVRAPHGSSLRENRLRAYRLDADAMISYLDQPPGLDRAFQQPYLFAKYGIALLTDSALRAAHLGAREGEELPPPVQNLLEMVDRLRTGQAFPGEPEVVLEVEGDLIGLELILTFGLPEASGFAGFAYGEIQAFLDVVLSRAPQWRGLAEHEWQTGNPEILRELPDSLQSAEVYLEASQALANLKEALNKEALKNLPAS